mgnify:CR=1 FL=1
MRIKEAAARSGLTQDTIRFYEKSGMLAPVRRDARGWRVFNGDDVNWLTTLERLRATGMPLDDVKRFAMSAHAPERVAPDQRALRLKKRTTETNPWTWLLGYRRSLLYGRECRWLG